MSQINMENSASAAAPQLADDAPTPTVTYYQQLAEHFSKALDEIAALIPQMEGERPATADFIRSHQNIPIVFLGTAIAAVEQVPELQDVRKLDVARARDTLQFIEAFRPMLDKFTRIEKSLAFTLGSRKANLAADALQIYAIAKGVARDPDASTAASIVQNLKRDLGRASALGAAAAAKRKALAAAAPEADKVAAQP
jgi:hypothetical protein